MSGDGERTIRVCVEVAVRADADDDTVGGAVFDNVSDLFHDDIVEIVDYEVERR